MYNSSVLGATEKEASSNPPACDGHLLLAGEPGNDRLPVLDPPGPPLAPLHGALAEPQDGPPLPALLSLCGR